MMVFKGSFVHSLHSPPGLCGWWVLVAACLEAPALLGIEWGHKLALSVNHFDACCLVVSVSLSTSETCRAEQAHCTLIQLMLDFQEQHVRMCFTRDRLATAFVTQPPHLMSADILQVVQAGQTMLSVLGQNSSVFVVCGPDAGPGHSVCCLWANVWSIGHMVHRSQMPQESDMFL